MCKFKWLCHCKMSVLFSSSSYETVSTNSHKISNFKLHTLQAGTPLSSVYCHNNVYLKAMCIATTKCKLFCHQICYLELINALDDASPKKSENHFSKLDKLAINKDNTKIQRVVKIYVRLHNLLDLI